MMENDKTTWGKLEQIATQRANRQVAVSKWNVNILITAYVVLATVILLRLEGVAIEIVAAIAIVGLFTIWFTAWRRGKGTYLYLYNEELNQLKELYGSEGVKVLTSSLLSSREMEILGCIASGYANKEIASRLKISSNTVNRKIYDLDAIL